MQVNTENLFNELPKVKKQFFDCVTQHVRPEAIFFPTIFMSAYTMLA